MEKSKILVVEDNEAILYNLKLMLELNGYQVTTATNGKKGLEVLNTMKSPPDLILSDIMMPEMDGYNFYMNVSKNPVWNLIPFVFLSAKSDPDDVRFGKRLGADDYITKPFKEDDLLAVIEGKLSKSRKNQVLTKQILDKIKIEQKPEFTDNLKETTFLMYISWDEKRGPTLIHAFPESVKNGDFLENLGYQLFNSSSAIYGYQGFFEPQGIFLNIANYKLDGYLYFDHIQDKLIRGGQRLYMLGVISSRIHYLDTLSLRELLESLSNKIKENELVDYKASWERIIEILSSGSLNK